MSQSSSPRIVFITGANTGLGLEVCKSLLQSKHASGYTILLGGRSIDKAEEAARQLQQSSSSDGKSTVTPIQIDITDDTSIERAHDTIKQRYGHIDVLINNAGVQTDAAILKGETSLRDGWAQNFDVNVTSTYVVTDSFADLLLQSDEPRLLFIASGTSSLDEASRGLPATATSPPAGWPKPKAFSFTAYRSSKAATNMMMLEWKRILRNDNVKIFAVSPGFLATGLGGVGSEALKKMGAIDPVIGANFVRDVVEGKRDDDHGKVIRIDAVQPW